MIEFYNITRTQFTLSQFRTLMLSNQLELNPAFQRRSVWRPKAKSFLMDTITRGLPIPIIFLRQRTDLDTLNTIYEVVDGQQRIRTSLAYLDKACLPKPIESDNFSILRSHNRALAGKSFDELETDVKRRLLDYQFSVHVLAGDTSDAEIIDMFRRMNATGTKLNSQELRNAQYYGEFAQSCASLGTGNLELWRRWGLFDNGAISRMAEIEFVAELVISFLGGISEKTQPVIDRFYGRYDDSFERREEVETAIALTLSLVNQAIGDEFRHTQFSSQILLYPLLNSMFDQVFGAAPLRDDVNPTKVSPDILRPRLLNASKVIANRIELTTEQQLALSSRSNRASNRNEIKRLIDQLLWR
jgi:hypothetical protein